MVLSGLSVFPWAGSLHVEYKSECWCIAVSAGLPPGSFGPARLRWMLSLLRLESVWATEIPTSQLNILRPQASKLHFKMDCDQAENSRYPSEKEPLLCLHTGHSVLGYRFVIQHLDLTFYRHQKYRLSPSCINRIDILDNTSRGGGTFDV